MIEASLVSLHEDGILGASARSIARRGGFNQALIFYHFTSVHELLLAAVEELSGRRSERYERRLSEVSTLRELVAVAGELHAEDLDDGHITVLSQMLAAAATIPELRDPMRERFDRGSTSSNEPSCGCWRGRPTRPWSRSTTSPWPWSASSSASSSSSTSPTRRPTRPPGFSRPSTYSPPSSSAPWDVVRRAGRSGG